MYDRTYYPHAARRRLALLRQFARPEAVKVLVQAVLTAASTIHFARTQVNPEDFATVPDWASVWRELVQALRAVGHPAGG